VISMADKKKEQATLERIYTIPLRHAFVNSARYKKTNRAVRAVRQFLEKHMKSEDVRLGQHLNLALWARGITHPPARVTVKAVKDAEGVVRAELENKVWKESVKPMPKDESSGSLQEKISSAIGGKKSKDDGEEPEAEEKPKAEKKAEPKDEKSDVKPEPKPKAKPKKAEPKDE